MEKISKQNGLLILAGLILCISFFVPWINFDGDSLTGSEMPAFVTTGLIKERGIFSDWIYVIYVLPIAPLLIIYGIISNETKIILFSEILIVLAFFYVSYEWIDHAKTLKILGIGFLLSGISTLIIFKDSMRRISIYTKSEQASEFLRFMAGLVKVIIIITIIFFLIISFLS